MDRIHRTASASRCEPCSRITLRCYRTRRRAFAFFGRPVHRAAKLHVDRLLSRLTADRSWPDPPIRGRRWNQSLVGDAVESKRPLTGCAVSSQNRQGAVFAQLANGLSTFGFSGCRRQSAGNEWFGVTNQSWELFLRPLGANSLSCQLEQPTYRHQNNWSKPYINRRVFI